MPASAPGHTWSLAVTIAAPDVAEDGIVVEFGAFKTRLRGWVDDRFDHGAPCWAPATR